MRNVVVGLMKSHAIALPALHRESGFGEAGEMKNESSSISGHPRPPFSLLLIFDVCVTMICRFTQLLSFFFTHPQFLIVLFEMSTESAPVEDDHELRDMVAGLLEKNGALAKLRVRCHLHSAFSI